MQGCNDGHCMKSHRLEPLNRSMLHYVVFFLQNVFSVAFYNEKWMVLPEGLELKHRKSMCAGLCLQILSCISWKTRAKYFAVENEKINRISSVIFFFHYSMISPVCTCAVCPKINVCFPVHTHNRKNSYLFLILPASTRALTSAQRVATFFTCPVERVVQLSGWI